MKIYKVKHEDLSINDVIHLLTPEKEDVSLYEELLGMPEGSFYRLSPEDLHKVYECLEGLEKVKDLDLNAKAPDTITIDGHTYKVDYNIKRHSWYAQQMFIDQSSKVDNYESIKIALAIYAQILIDGKIGTEKRVEEVYDIIEHQPNGTELFRAGFFLLKSLGKKKKITSKLLKKLRRKKENMNITINH